MNPGLKIVKISKFYKYKFLIILTLISFLTKVAKFKLKFMK